MRKSEKQGRDAVLKIREHKRKRVDDLEADVDALFRLPLAEFTDARNALAARLKKSGRGDEAVQACMKDILRHRWPTTRATWFNAHTTSPLQWECASVGWLGPVVRRTRNHENTACAKCRPMARLAR